MNSNISRISHKSNRRNFELQRDIIEDMYVYELSFADWNEIDDDMNVYYGDDMIIDYYEDDDNDELMAELYKDIIMDDDNNIQEYLRKQVSLSYNVIRRSMICSSLYID